MCKKTVAVCMCRELIRNGPRCLYVSKTVKMRPQAVCVKNCKDVAHADVMCQKPLRSGTDSFCVRNCLDVVRAVSVCQKLLRLSVSETV